MSTYQSMATQCVVCICCKDSNINDAYWTNSKFAHLFSCTLYLQICEVYLCTKFEKKESSAYNHHYHLLSASYSANCFTLYCLQSSGQTLR
jgi:hypothetical protein